jgi:mRNA interferase MazF
VTTSVPDVGDIVWLEFDPQAGHEQAGRRPALVLSPAQYNRKSGLALCCPITKQIKGYPFEVALDGAADATGVVLADQVRSLDWRARRARAKGRAAGTVIEDVAARIRTLIPA